MVMGFGFLLIWMGSCSFSGVLMLVCIVVCTVLVSSTLLGLVVEYSWVARLIVLLMIV